MANSSSDIPGMPCPSCRRRIVIEMQHLLCGRPYTCECGLVLHVDRERSRETLEGLLELNEQLTQRERCR